jgi:hypothetical protein
MLRYVDADLSHGFDRFRANKAGRNASAFNFKPIASHLAQESFRHLTARGISCAQN